jgi:hypothetical protein
VDKWQLDMLRHASACFDMLSIKAQHEMLSIKAQHDMPGGLDFFLVVTNRI